MAQNGDMGYLNLFSSYKEPVTIS